MRPFGTHTTSAATALRSPLICQKENAAATHIPVLHVPEQHCAPASQACPELWQTFVHRPPVLQTPEQHCVPASHEPPPW